MASIKKIKKDIDYLFYELISDCFTFASVNPMESDEELSALISEAVQKRNEFVVRANNPDGKETPALVRAHYQKLNTDLFTTVEKLFDRLRDLAVKRLKSSEK